MTESRRTKELKKQLAESELCDKLRARLSQIKCPFCGGKVEFEESHYAHFYHSTKCVYAKCPCGVINTSSSKKELPHYGDYTYSECLRELCSKFNV